MVDARDPHRVCDGELRLYYGAADTCVGLITARIADVLDWLRTQPSERNH